MCLVVDLRGLSWELMWQVSSLSDIQRGVAMWKDTFPCKLRRVLVVRASAVSEFLIETVLSFVAPKIQQRYGTGCGGICDSCPLMFNAGAQVHCIGW